MAVSFSGEGRSWRSHSTSPNVAPAATNTATTATVKNKRHGKAFMVRTAGWKTELAVLLSSRQSGGGVISRPFRSVGGTPAVGNCRAGVGRVRPGGRRTRRRAAGLSRDVDQAVGLLAATQY